MRRTPVVAVMLALMASALIAGSPASAVPYEGTRTGVMSAKPSTFTVDQEIVLLANFPSTQASKTIDFLKETSPGSGDYTSLGPDVANQYGNAYFTLAVDAEQAVFARAPNGNVTQLLPLKPTVIVPENFPVTGALSMNPSTVTKGGTVVFLANFPSGTFDVTLYEETSPDVWSAIGVDRSNSSGNAYFNDIVINGSRKLFALTATGKRTEVDIVQPKAVVELSIQRDCTVNDCAATATASGGIDPAQAGRSFILQRKSGTSWVAVGSPATTGADGKVEIQFGLDGVPQWSTRIYRLHSAAGPSTAAATSREIQFMPGPTQLGPNVLRVDVENGVYPTTKGPEYTGVATLSVNGTPTFDHVPLENFGVRGNSSVKYTKKPYKLKFLDKPAKGTTVFGMPRGKTWTLLATWRDRSLVREKASLDLGRRLAPTIAWTPQSRYVEMFVNDQYRGSYLMTESVKIDADRVNVDETHGMIMETDGTAVEDSSLGFLGPKSKTAFAFKDPDERKTLAGGTPDPKSVTSAKLTAIKNRISAFETKLYSAATRGEYPNFIDVDSAIDFMFVKEFTKDYDAAFDRSHYFSWDPSDPGGTSDNPLRDGKFHFGPAWDFDASAGGSVRVSAAGDYLRDPEGWMMRGTGTPSGDGTYTTHWFVQLFKDAGWNAAVKARWTEVKGEFAKVHQTETAALKAAIGVGAENDRNRWASEPQSHPTLGTYEQDVAFVTGWYEDRFTWMDDQLTD